MNLPVEYLEKEYRDNLMSLKVDSSVSELEKMISEEGTYQVFLPHIIANEFNKIMKPWVLDSAWQHIGNNSLEGILSKIKSTLLEFLLNLNKEFGDNDNLSIMKKKSEVQDIFQKTIGSINGDNLNISIGDKSSQAVNNAENSNMNVAAGDNVNQTLNIEHKIDIEGFIKVLKEHLEKLELTKEDKEDVQTEIIRVENQLQRDNPKMNIINGALSTLNGILTGIAANAYTPIILEKLNALII